MSIKIKPKIWVFLLSGAVGVFILLAGVFPAGHQHFLWNLEPYPDGLFYVTAGKELALHGQFGVPFIGGVLHPQISLIYTIFLAIGSFFSVSPAAFYLVNVLLGVGTVLFLFLTLKDTTQKPFLTALGLIVYLSHAIVYWLPSVPMAENLALFVFMADMYIFNRFSRRQTGLDFLLLISLTFSLIFTKYTFIGVGGIIALFTFYQLLRRRNWRYIWGGLGVTLLGVCVFGAFQTFQGQNLFSVLQLQNSAATSKIIGTSVYSFGYLIPNARHYLLSLLGWQSQFLWLHTPIFSFGILSVFVFLSLVVIRKYKDMRVLLYFLLFLALFPLLLIFYAFDQRYIILAVPLFALSLPQIYSRLSESSWARPVLVCLFLAVGIQAVSQVGLLRMIVAANWLHRSTAWQYESVQVLNAQLPNQSYVITVLPPLFIDLYTNHHYRVLPLSLKQEFLDKKQYVWGADIDYENLAITYRQLLEQNQQVFITNAYLSSQHEFASDFTAISDQFSLQKVADGCLGTCTVYQLSVKK